MSATHVQVLMALQSAASQLSSAVSALQTLTRQHSSQLFIIQSAGYVVTGIRQGNGHSSKINLALSEHDVRTGEDFDINSGCTINGATELQAGAMTALHVQKLETAKTDITALQSAMRKVQNAGRVVTGALVFHIATDKVGIQLFGYDLATGEREIEMQNFYLTAASQYGAGVMTAQHVKQLNALLDVIDTGALLASPKDVAMRADGRFFEVSLSQAFLEYGLWQDYGTGRETPRKSSAERELAHTSAEAQPGSRLRHPPWQ